MKEKKFYERYDDRYYDREYYPKKHIIKFITFQKNKKDIKWLDIGCSLGYLVKEVLEEGIDAYGIDISEYAIKNAVVENRVKYGSITDIPFEDNTFDVVSAFDVIEHIYPKDTEKAILEMYRVLKNNGFLILTTPNPCFIGDWIYDLTHINVRPPKYWKEILKKYGFKVKLSYVPSFLKYYVSEKFSVTLPIPNRIAFWLEEPFRYIIGWLYNRKGRLYILARKKA